MNLYSITFSKLTNNNGIKIKREIYGKIDPNYYCILTVVLKSLKLLMKKN